MYLSRVYRSPAQISRLDKVTTEIFALSADPSRICRVVGKKTVFPDRFLCNRALFTVCVFTRLNKLHRRQSSTFFSLVTHMLSAPGRRVNQPGIICILDRDLALSLSTLYRIFVTRFHEGFVEGRQGRGENVAFDCFAVLSTYRVQRVHVDMENVLVIGESGD